MIAELPIPRAVGSLEWYRARGKSWQEIGEELGVSAEAARSRSRRSPGAWTYRVVVISDVHSPYEHGPSVEAAIGLIQEVSPEIVVVNGDLYDCTCLSRFPHNAYLSQRLVDETRRGREILSRITEVAPGDVVFLEGNHEERLSRYITSTAPAIDGSISARDVFTPEGVDHYIPYRTFASIGGVLITHGHRISQLPLGSARLHRVFGHSLVVGHSHRAGVAWVTYTDGAPTALIETGHLSDPPLVPGWTVGDNWQRCAGTVLTFSSASGLLGVEQCLEGPDGLYRYRDLVLSP